MKRIRDVLVERYGAGGIAPYGALASVAREFGLSRQRIFQVARSVGISATQTPATQHACEVCGLPVSRRSRWCRAHEKESRRKYGPESMKVCTECGTQFQWTVARQRSTRRNVNLGRTSPDALTNPVCSPACGARRGVRGREQRRHDRAGVPMSRFKG